MGRRKIEIERIVDKHDRFICFSKQRKGLFKKANVLVLQGFHIIILVFSKSRNAFVYGSQNAKEIIKRFLNNSDATNGAGSSNAAENLINEMILASETAERTEENNTSSEHSVDSAKRTEENDKLSSETGKHSVDSAERTEEIDKLSSETGEILKESDITRTVASEDSWNSLNSILTESKHFWWNSSVENLFYYSCLLVEQTFLSGFT